MLLSLLICLRIQSLQPQQGSLAPRSRRIQAGYCLLLVAVLGIVVGWRKGVGTDYGNYIDIFTLTRDKTYSQILNEDEPFWGVLNLFCSNLFGDYIPVFVVAAFLSVGLIVYGIYKSSISFPVSVFLLIAGMYYFDLFNGTRQMVATVILFAAYPLIEKKKWGWLLLLTLIAMQFHSSAWIVLVAFLFARFFKPRSWATVLLVSVFLIIYLNFDFFSDYLIEFLISSNSRYSNYETTLSQADLGANVLRFGLTAVPPLFSLVLWPHVKHTGKDTGTLVNLSIINACFMMIATRNWIFARFCMFFGIYNILLWPRILECFEPKSKRFMTIGVVAVYFLYFWLIVHTDSNLLPYRSWLFGGTYA